MWPRVSYNNPCRKATPAGAETRRRRLTNLLARSKPVSPHPTPIRAVAYYRKSNDDDGSSIDQQREWARRVAAEKGVAVEQEFADQAKKGHETATRTAFHEMLAFCQGEARKGQPVDAVLCWH